MWFSVPLALLDILQNILQGGWETTQREVAVAVLMRSRQGATAAASLHSLVSCDPLKTSAAGREQTR
jgi:hypothetical protein